MAVKFWCNYKALAKLPIIGDPQCFDGNRKVVLLTKHPAFKSEYRCTGDVLASFKASNLHNECRGLHVVCIPKRGPDSSVPPYHVIYVDHLLTGDRKVLTTILHEVSHLIDYLIDAAHIELVDTEVRAYMLQYYTEKIYNMMDFSFSTRYLDKHKKEDKAKEKALKLDIKKDKAKEKTSKRDIKIRNKLTKLKVKLVKKLKLNNTDELYTLATDKQIRDTKLKNIELFFTKLK